jgi:hypothetical protein
MAVYKKTEEQQKDLIFDIFSQWQNSTYSDRTQTYFLQLCEQIYKWYKDYRPKKADDMGLEISEVINNVMNKEKKLNIPKDKDGFFKYLNTALSNERAGSFREFDEDKTIRITKEVKAKLKKSREYIIGEERQLGRKLTYDERIKGISEWFKEQEYVDLLNVINVGRISYASNDENNEIDTLNFIYTHSYDSPLDEYIKKTNMETILETVKSLLNKKQERARDCDRALFTLYCIKNDLKGLYPVLDQEIIDSFHKDGKEPKQYVIYLKYHPKVQKSSAEAMAAKNLGEFLKEIKTCLKEII